MTAFHDLYTSHQDLLPGEQQAAVEREFRALLEKVPLYWRVAGAPVSPAAKSLVLGVATHSEADMRLLDLVADALMKQEARRLNVLAQRQVSVPGAVGFIQGPPAPLRVEVFSARDCRTHEDFARYIPGIGKVYQTPAVGFWVDGELREKAWGAPGRALVARVCGFDPVLAYPKSS
jgi:hypothetical protein